MSEQKNERPTPPKRRAAANGRASRAPKTSKQQTATLERPKPDDRWGWYRYWEAHGQPWRKEPEIDKARQEYLAECRAIKPDIEQGIYPFKNIKLSRADIEWMLETHGSGQGPVRWNDAQQRERVGIDLRGANLQGLDLSYLPLARLRCGLSWIELYTSSHAYRELRRSEWPQELLSLCHLAAAHLEKARLRFAELQGAWFIGVYLEDANLNWANLEKAELRWAHLERATLRETHLEGAYLIEAHLEQADLRRAYFSSATRLNWGFLGHHDDAAWLSDIRWGGVNLATIEWSQVEMLGEEYRSRQAKDDQGKKPNTTRIYEYETAVRANRQLAIALQAEGMNEEADRFAYRSHLLQRVVLRRQRKWLKYLASWFFWLIAGYGYRPLHSLIAYLLIIFGFMGLYLLNAQIVAPHLTWDQALVLSVSSFHGRGFFEQDITLGSGYARLAAAEAVLGLLIEISFIATFTQRFFGK